MAVIDHPVHELVREKSDAKWGCWNRSDFAAGYFAPDRQYEECGTYFNATVFIPHVMSTECRNDSSLTDRKCQGCKHAGSGEAYSASVRSAAS